MESNGGGSRLVVTELSHIKELVKELDVHLGSSPDLCKYLARQIFTVTEKSISMIRSGHLGFHGRKRSAVGAGLDSPPFSATPSPLSGVSDMPFMKNKKRKTMEKGKRQVRVGSAGGGADGHEDDGYSWRKYGQKDILGSQHPRGYYRCTYQKSQGCAARKQVQRADEDPSLYDVIYNGEHTCVHKATAAAAAKAQPGDARSLLQSLSSSLKVETEGLTPKAQQQGWGATTPPFSFSSPAVSGLTPSTPESCFGQGVSAPTSLEPSPATSGSNHLSMRARCEFDTMVSALMTATSMPPPLAMEETTFSLDEIDLSFDDFDVSCFFAPDY
uniref:Uncharacterized protein n=1 Tax=Avena sativa TaxID=4498 RepID=A0ACD5XR71_AVESA